MVIFRVLPFYSCLKHYQFEQCLKWKLLASTLLGELFDSSTRLEMIAYFLNNWTVKIMLGYDSVTFSPWLHRACGLWKCVKGLTPQCLIFYFFFFTKDMQHVCFNMSGETAMTLLVIPTHGFLELNIQIQTQCPCHFVTFSWHNYNIKSSHFDCLKSYIIFFVFKMANEWFLWAQLL